MSNHPSAEKRARQAEKRRAGARILKGKVRAEMKKIDQLLAEGRIQEALAAGRQTESVVAKAVSKGVIKKGTASRIISRMTRKIGRSASTAPGLPTV